MDFIANVQVLVILTVGILSGRGCVLEQPIGDGKPNFINEISSTEIAYVGNAKSLDCAAVNFCSVTWYKDGIPLPWAPQEAAQDPNQAEKSQILRFKQLEFGDQAEYTCIVSNGVENINRTIRLVVLEDSRADKPIFLGSNGGSCTDRTAEVGETVRFSCEFFVGKALLTQSFVSWYRVDKKGQTPAEWLEDIETQTEQSSRMDSVIVSNLEIPNIKDNAFGSWMALIYSNGYQADAVVSVNPSPTGNGGTAKSLLEKIKMGFQKHE
ncbi:uncharacterized protein LOC119723744 [Patiria miniata]|uniref:Soluble interferon alpha/beta receptor OPG204 n=1 Tax=Patiria miniata TaxID=46514 RepID=A0A913ZFD7_PATMI|nr:uncharacterized protein LOC119723744 [Patiria miniata]